MRNIKPKVGSSQSGSKTIESILLSHFIIELKHLWHFYSRLSVVVWVKNNQLRVNSSQTGSKTIKITLLTDFYTMLSTKIKHFNMDKLKIAQKNPAEN